MAQIEYVCVGGDTEGLAGATMDIHLDNGQTLLFSFRPLADAPAFRALLQDGRLFKPKTDGSRVYWQDGPNLTLEKIMALL